MSYGIAPSRSATLTTWSFGTNKNVGCLSINRLISQGHAVRSTRAFSRVTHFMRPSSTCGCWSVTRLGCHPTLRAEIAPQQDEHGEHIHGAAKGPHDETAKGLALGARVRAG